MPKPPIVPLELDLSGWFGPGGLVRGELNEIAPQLEQARRQVVVETGIVDWPRRLLDEYRERRAASRLGRVLTTARFLADRMDRVVVLGGGSMRRAAEALFVGCCHPYHNELSRSERACKPRLYFVGDTFDNDHLQGLLDLFGQCQPDGSADTAWGILAIESLDHAAQMAMLDSLLTALSASCGGNRQQMAERLVPVMRKGSELAALADKWKLPSVFEIPPEAGQGGGAFCPGSLLVAVLLGLDVVALLDGAVSISCQFVDAPTGRNSVLDFAGGQQLLAARYGTATRQLSIGDRALSGIASWYECLLAEQAVAQLQIANAKSHLTTAPIVAEQPNIACDTALCVERPRRDRLSVATTPADTSAAELENERVPELFRTASATLRLRQVNEAALGQLLQMLQLATAIETRLGRQTLGEVLQNSYNQTAARRADFSDKETSMATTLTWLGHASWLIETSSHTLLVDPFLNDSPTAPLKAADLKPDFILISHGHYDHVADAATIAAKHESTVVANYEICEWLGKQGVESTQPMNLGGGIDLPFGRVKMTIAHHSSTLPDGASGGAAGGFLLSIGGKHIYLACDTGLFYDMKLIGAVGLDLAVLPIGDRFTMGPDDALEAVKLLLPKRVVPSHYNTWPPIEQDGAAWAARVQQETGVEAVAINPGEKIKL